MNRVWTEQEVISHWNHGTVQTPIVSICCATYNHADYIEETINSFLSQVSSFAFEILIHDDASTDGTAQVLKEYQAKFPNIIKLFIQSENQYSQGKKLITPTFLFPHVIGKYVALCEGDDCWTDCSKLDKQVHVLNESNEDICFHSASLYEGDVYKGVCCRRAAKSTHIPVSKVILGGGHFMPTASILFRSSKLEDIFNFVQKNPNTPYGDYFWQVLLSRDSGAYYINSPMSLYRMFSSNSWTEKMKQDCDFSFENDKLFLESLKSLSAWLTDSQNIFLNRYLKMKLFSVLMNCQYSFAIKRQLASIVEDRLNFSEVILVKVFSRICLGHFKAILKKILNR